MCKIFGKSKQGYYKVINYQKQEFIEQEIVIEMVKRVQKKAKTKRWGARKKHQLIMPELKALNIKMGRDKFFDLLRQEDLLVQTRKRNYFTTQSHHWLRKYDYLIEGMELTEPNQLWVSDITYVKSQLEVLYLYLITDAYSKMIVGWYISIDLKAKSAVYALKMALKNNPTVNASLIHHSDRGVQYCSNEYVSLLQKHNIQISMTKGASPQQNAIAERINGILKEEWIYDMKLKDLKQSKKKIKQIITIYNMQRPHQTLNYDIPNEVHQRGFIRHKIKSIIIGKEYEYKKKVEAKQPQPSCN